MSTTIPEDRRSTDGVGRVDESQVDALIDDLEEWYSSRKDAPLAVQDLLARLPETPATEHQRARLTLLSVYEVVRDHGAAEAFRTALGIRDRATDGGDRDVQARAEHRLSWLSRTMGDRSAALEHAVAGLALDGDDLDETLRYRLRLVAADAFALCGSLDEARGRYREALEHARSLRHHRASLLVLNNWAYSELVAGELAAAADLAERLQHLALEHGLTLPLASVSTIAEVLQALGRPSEAIAVLREHLEADRWHDLFDVAGCWLTLAQVERETGDLDAALASLDTADHLAAVHRLHALRVEGLEERAELLAACGDHAGAYETHLRFHAQTLALRSAAAEARAQTQHATFEADAARREATRYREMSIRDPLTGLYNRRHVDEDLDHRLATGQPLAVAMVDLDHFKRVNDTCSHEAGDAVLVRLARLLEDAVAAETASPEAYAARLGGEEFLLALPHHDLADAHTVAETLRERIEAHRWSDIAPGLPITASIGLAVTLGGSSPPPSRADLLREADTYLYAAKDGGRNRVAPTVRRSRP